MIRNYDENALLESSGIALLFNLLLSVLTRGFKSRTSMTFYLKKFHLKIAIIVLTFDFILSLSLNLCFIIDLVLS